MSFLNELKRRNVLRVATAYIVSSWLLIQVSETIFPLFGYGDTPARLVVIVLAIAFIPSLIFSWVFEITPEGLKRDADIDREQSTTQVTGKKLDRIILIVLALALAYFAFDKFVLDPVRDQSKLETARQEGRTEALVESYGEKSIAVLPFVDMSSNKDQEYMSDGIAEELLNLLAKIPELRVISRSSSFSYKGKDIKLVEVARELNVDHILEGSVRKSGNELRITAQLIAAQSDTHLWSETFDRTLDDIFSIQDEIANEVVQALVSTMLGEATPKVRETDQEAYTLYLRGRHFAQASTLEGFQKADTYLHEALAIDPDFTPAWTALGSLFANGARAGFLGYDEGFRQARAANQKALELDPNFAEAYGGLAFIAMMYDRDFEVAAEYIQQARILAPNSLKTLSISSIFAEILGRIDQAIEFGERALRMDPLNVTFLVNLAAVYSYAGRFDQAEESLRKALELRPGMESALLWLAKLHLRQGRPDAALAAAQKITNEQFRLWTLPMAYHDLGQAEASDMALSKLKETYADTAASFIAENYAWRGEIDLALDWLDRAIEEGQFMWGVTGF